MDDFESEGRRGEGDEEDGAYCALAKDPDGFQIVQVQLHC